MPDAGIHASLPSGSRALPPPAGWKPRSQPPAWRPPRRSAGLAAPPWPSTARPTIRPSPQADRAAEAILRRELLAAFPDDAFLGEESGAAAGTSGYEWIVDPIDGTKSFVRGVPLYATLVGCRRAGPRRARRDRDPGPRRDRLRQPTAAAPGIVRGGGAAARRAVSSRGALAEGLVCSSDFVDFARWSGRPRGGTAAPERLDAAAGLVRTWGDGYGYLLVATGRAEVMVDPRLQCLGRRRRGGGRRGRREAGSATGRAESGIDSGDGVATNGLVHEELLGLLRGSETQAGFRRPV